MAPITSQRGSHQSQTYLYSRPTARNMIASYLFQVNTQDNVAPTKSVLPDIVNVVSHSVNMIASMIKTTQKHASL